MAWTSDGSSEEERCQRNVVADMLLAADFGDAWGLRMVLGGELDSSSERTGGLLGGVLGGGPRGVSGDMTLENEIAPVTTAVVGLSGGGPRGVRGEATG